MTRSAFLAIFSTFQGKKILLTTCNIEKSNKLNAGRTGEKVLDWVRPGSGMSCDMGVPHTAGGRQQALYSSVSPLKYRRP